MPYHIEQCKALSLWLVINTDTGLAHSSWTTCEYARTMCRELNVWARRAKMGRVA